MADAILNNLLLQKLPQYVPDIDPQSVLSVGAGGSKMHTMEKYSEVCSRHISMVFMVAGLSESQLLELRSSGLSSLSGREGFYRHLKRNAMLR